MKHELQQMLRNGGGAIVNCSSLGGVVGNPGLAAYHAAKHGVLGLTKTAALEYAARGIRINAVCPGSIDTPMAQSLTGGDPAVLKNLVKLEPIGRLGKPEEIAAAVLWLCSPAPATSSVTRFSLTADIQRKSPTPAASCRPSIPKMSPRILKPSRRSCGISWSRILR